MQGFSTENDRASSRYPHLTNQRTGLSGRSVGRFAPGALLAAFCLLSGGALAQQGPTAQGTATSSATKPEAERLADEAFERGLDAATHNRWEEAFTEYTKAFEIKKTTYTAGNLGAVEHRLGRFALAAEHLSYALTADEPPAFREKHNKWLATAKEHVATVTLTGLPAGAIVLVDGKQKGVAPLPVPLFLDPGAHTISARANEEEQSRPFAATAGATGTVAFGFPAQPKVAPTQPAKITAPLASSSQAPAVGSEKPTPPVDAFPHQTRHNNTARPVVLISEAALAGGALIAALAFRSHGTTLRNEAKLIRRDVVGGSCSGADPTGLCQQLQDKSSASDTASRLTVGFTVAGGVLAAATVGTWLIWKPKKQETVKVRAVPIAGAGTVGLGFVGQF